MLRRLLRDEGGATAIEYGLIVALVCVALVGALSTLGGSVGTLYSWATLVAAAITG